MGGLPNHLFPEEKMLSETQGSALGKAVPPQALKKGPCSCSAFFFFPSGLNPLLESDVSISRETSSLRSQGLSRLPLSFHRGSLSSKAEARSQWGVGLTGPPQVRSIASPGCSQATCVGLHAEARATTGPL